MLGRDRADHHQGGESHTTTQNPYIFPCIYISPSILSHTSLPHSLSHIHPFLSFPLFAFFFQETSLSWTPPSPIEHGTPLDTLNCYHATVHPPTPGTLRYYVPHPSTITGVGGSGGGGSGAGGRGGGGGGDSGSGNRSGGRVGRGVTEGYLLVHVVDITPSEPSKEQGQGLGQGQNADREAVSSSSTSSSLIYQHRDIILSTFSPTTTAAGGVSIERGSTERKSNEKGSSFGGVPQQDYDSTPQGGVVLPASLTSLRADDPNNGWYTLLCTFTPLGRDREIEGEEGVVSASVHPSSHPTVQTLARDGDGGVVQTTTRLRVLRAPTRIQWTPPPAILIGVPLVVGPGLASETGLGLASGQGLELTLRQPQPTSPSRLENSSTTATTLPSPHLLALVLRARDRQPAHGANPFVKYFFSNGQPIPPGYIFTPAQAGQQMNLMHPITLTTFHSVT